MELIPWMQSITPDDMPNDDLRFIAEKAGMQSALALLFCTPGLTVSIPKNPFKIIKEEYIKNNYDGTKYAAVLKDIFIKYCKKMPKRENLNNKTKNS